MNRQRNIVILTDSPFSKRDYDRFGIEILQQRFNLTVIDCTAWLKPDVWMQYSEIVYPLPQHIIIHGWTEFSLAIAAISNGLAIDYLGESGFSRRIYQTLKNNGILRVIVKSGLLPALRLTIFQRLKMLYWQSESLCRLSTRLLSRIQAALGEKLPSAEIAVLSGEDSVADPRVQVTTHKIWAHSFDYDLYLSARNPNGMPPKPYAVFLDMDLVYHSDFLYTDTKPPVTAEKYYPVLLDFFDLFERIAGMDVIVAGHPRSRYDLHPDLFSKRVPVMFRTAELVRDASIVLCHDSTAISFAILWQKPIVFLTSEQLKRSLFGFDIELFRNTLGAPLVNIDSPEERNIDLKEWFCFDEYAYSDYRKRYIKKPETPELPLWEIFSDYVQKNIR